MKVCGLYRVLGKREYRGHAPGTVFPAVIDPKAEHRAVMRGSIEKLGEVEPCPGNYTLPRGWLEDDNQNLTQRRRS